jgi:hypothetical protein
MPRIYGAFVFLKLNKITQPNAAMAIDGIRLSPVFVD